MFIWVDDMRLPPFGWDWFQTSQATIAQLECFPHTTPWHSLSLDHDLGQGSKHDAIVIIDWMIQNNYWPKHIYLHTANPVGHANMRRAIERAAPPTVTLHTYSPRQPDYRSD